MLLPSILLSHTIKENYVTVLDTESYNACLAQDKEGFLWIATTDGLIKYDGYSKKRYNYNNDFPILSNAVSCLFIDSENIIWFNTVSQGLYSFDKESNKLNSHKYDPSNLDSISSKQFNWAPQLIAEDKDRLIWIGTKDGLNAYSKKTKNFTRYKSETSGLCNNDILVVFVDSKNVVWAGTRNGLCKYDKKLNVFTSYKNDPNNSTSLLNNTVYALAEDKEGNIWIGTEGGLSKYSSKTNQFASYKHNPDDPNSLQVDCIFFLLSDKDNNLWICHNYNVSVGIERYDIVNNKFTLYEANLMSKNISEKTAIVTCFQDKTGTLWLMDNLSKIYQLNFSQEKVSSFHRIPFMPNSLKSNDIFVITEDNNQNLWFGTQRGISRFDNKTKEFVDFDVCVNSTNLFDKAVRILLEDKDGIFWIGTYDGCLYAFDKDKKLIGQYKNNLLTGYMIGMLEDNSDSNVFWIGSEIDGFFKFDKRTGVFKQYKNNQNDPNTLGNNTVLCIFQDKNGIIWLPTLEGLNKFDPGSEKFKRYVHDLYDDNSISGNSVVACCFDSQDNFWITTYDSGLNKFDTKREIFKHYRKKDGFPTDATRNILEDDNCNLWIGTGDIGIIVFNILSEKIVDVYDDSVGLQGNVFRDFGKSSIKRNNGELWFSGLNGVSKINPKALLLKNTQAPPIYLTSFSCKGDSQIIKDRSINKVKKITLPWNRNSFEFEFVALNYINSFRNKYAYKLEGFEKEWNHIGTNHFGRYTNIPPGEYILKLKGSNNDGLWNEEGISIKITR